MMKRLALLCVLLAACATPQPSAIPSTVVPITAPTPSVSPPALLRVDGLATVAPANGLRVWRVPSTKKADRLEPPLAAGALVYVTDGPRMVSNAAWWAVEPDFGANPGARFGWVLERDANRIPNLVPTAVPCPAIGGPVLTTAVRTLGMLKTLACFGNHEIELQGWVSCSWAAIDAAVAGPSWLAANWMCDIDSTVGLNGSAAGALLNGQSNPTIARYSVRGHFDDPEARLCFFIPFGTSISGPVAPPDPGAVVVCRQLFVVTSLTKLD